LKDLWDRCSEGDERVLSPALRAGLLASLQQLRRRMSGVVSGTSPRRERRASDECLEPHLDRTASVRRPPPS